MESDSNNINLFSILSIALLIIITCGINVKAAADNIIWKEYENNYYKINYPAAWNKIEYRNRVTFINGKGFQFYIEIDQEINSLDEFHKKVNTELNFIKTQGKIEEFKKIIFQGEPAYKAIITFSKNKVGGIYVYKKQTRFGIGFRASNNQYDRNLKIAKKMIDSFKFKKFKVVTSLSEDSTVVKGRKLTAQQAIEDVKYLYDRITQIYPKAYYNINKELISNNFNKIIDKLQGQEKWSKLELYKIVAKFIAVFRDGHTKFFSDVVFKNYDKYCKQGGKVFPLLVGVRKGRIFVVSNLSKKNIPEIGSEILAINGTDTSKLLNKMRNKISYTAEGWAYQIIEDFFAMRLWLEYGGVDSYSIKYKAKSGDIKLVSLSGISLDKYRERKKFLEKLFVRKDKLKLSYLQNSVALLTVSTFSPNHISTLNFKRNIEKYFKEIKKRECKVLIIDVRNNGGGDNSLGAYLHTFIAKNINTNKYHFKGKVYILIGRRPLSAGVDFVNMVKENGSGILVGEETGDAANCIGNPIRDKLPNSGLEFRIASTSFYTPTEYNSKRGVIPDIKVDVDSVKKAYGEDQVLNKVLDIIKVQQ